MGPFGSAKGRIPEKGGLCGRQQRRHQTQFSNCSLENLKQSETKFVRKNIVFYETAAIFCFMLSLFPKLKHFRGPIAQLTDSAELAIAKDKLLLLAQSELFSVEFKQLQSRIPVKRSSRIAGYSPFIGPGALIRFTGRIQRLAEINFETKHLISILVACW